MVCTLRRGLGAIVLGALIGLGSSATWAQDTVRIGLPTKTYYPTIIAETAQRQKLFDKEGIKAELTIYRSGGETFEAGAAGAADLQLNSVSILAAGRRKGVETKAVAGTALGYYGWYLMVRADSPVTDAAQLDGKKVGITAAGSGSDFLARWAMQDRKIKFTEVPLGGGGLVPNLLSGNVDAIVLYSPLSFKVMQDKSARSLLDFGASVPQHLTGVWIASDKYIKEKPQAIQKALNALYGGLAYLRANRAEAIKMIAEIDEIPPKVAEAELDGDLSKLSTTGEMKEEWVARALDFSKLIGMTDLAPAADCYVTTFRPHPTVK
ncbi:MAG TPA: ABC transporter substrate-binding protein [Candidatus Sulfotelmatobacter sp.]|nr:ABC transporter substrate-binding protein [Candidatus Sulfotelmatobacter sp.]